MRNCWCALRMYPDALGNVWSVQTLSNHQELQFPRFRQRLQNHAVFPLANRACPQLLRHVGGGGARNDYAVSGGMPGIIGRRRGWGRYTIPAARLQLLGVESSKVKYGRPEFILADGITSLLKGF